MLQKNIKIMSWTVLGYGVSFIAQVMLAKTFGISGKMDAFLIASSLPVFITGTLSGVFINVFTVIFTNQKNTSAHTELLPQVSGIITVNACCLIMLSLVTFIGADTFTRFLAPGFSAADRVFAVDILRVLSFSIVFTGAAAITSSMLYSKERFTLPSLSQGVVSLCVIASLVLASKKYHIYSPAIGMLAGACVVFLIQSFALRRLHTGVFRPRFDLSDPLLRKAWALFFPLLLTSLLFYANRLVTQIFASYYAAGTISALSYSYNISVMVAVITGGTISTLCFPALIRHAGGNDMIQSGRVFVSSFRLLILIVVPAIVVLTSLSSVLIRLFFERGEFTREATAMTASLLCIYAVGILPYALDTLISRVLYAFERVGLRLAFMVVLFISNFVLVRVLSPWYGMRGIAAAHSLSFFILSLISLRSLSRFKISILTPETAGFLGKSAMAAFVMALVMRTIDRWLLAYSAADTFRVIFGVTGGLAAFFLCALALKISEIPKFIEARSHA